MNNISKLTLKKMASIALFLAIMGVIVGGYYASTLVLLLTLLLVLCHMILDYNIYRIEKEAKND